MVGNKSIALLILYKRVYRSTRGRLLIAAVDALCFNLVMVPSILEPSNQMEYVRLLQGRLLTWYSTFVFRYRATDCPLETPNKRTLLCTPPQAGQLLALDHVDLKGTSVIQMPLAIQRLHTKVPASEPCEIHP